MTDYEDYFFDENTVLVEADDNLPPPEVIAAYLENGHQRQQVEDALRYDAEGYQSDPFFDDPIVPGEDVKHLFPTAEEFRKAREERAHGPHDS